MRNAIFILALVLFSCNQDVNHELIEPSPEFKDYWYDGKAETSTYKIERNRYGEIRTGNLSLIFVTEDFSDTYNTKIEQPDDQSIPVLKMNWNEQFQTGIYPYTIMTSSFNSIKNRFPIKVSCGIQEWCGNSYMELNKEKDFNVSTFSYFQGERAVDRNMPVTYMEDGFWSLIRINPSELPNGEVKVIPSFSYLRMDHVDLKDYTAICRNEVANQHGLFSIDYVDLNRALRIKYDPEFPHTILGWEIFRECEDCAEGTTVDMRAEIIQSSRLDYWNLNSVEDSVHHKVIWN